MYTNKRVVYVGAKNQWTFYKDLLPGFKGEITEFIETSNCRNFIVEFENGLCVSINPEDLRLLN